MKLCKDCKYIGQYRIHNLTECIHPNAVMSVSTLYGSKSFTTQREQRLDESGCGPSAKWFEQKQHISDRLKEKAEQLFGKYWS